jgi:anaerobic selenocysteine-containing dehydrogenase
MAQTESPEIVAAQEQGETKFIPVEDATSAGTEPVTSDDAVPAGADAVGDETHPAPEAQAESMEASAAGSAATDDAPAAAPAPSRPTLVHWQPTGAVADPPTIDAYSLRLVVSRKLYDGGTLVQHSPSLARLAPDVALRISATDLDRLGVTSGGKVRVTSSRTSLDLDVVADASVPRGVAHLVWGAEAARLIDVSAPVTDLRVETR